MSHPVDSPERKAALAASTDLVTVRAAARRNHVSMRRLRWRVQGRICFTFQPYGTPYREWGSLGRVYLDEQGVLEEAEYLGAVPTTGPALADALDLHRTIGVPVTNAQPGEVVEVVLAPLDAITLDMVAVPTIDIPVRNPETGAIEVVHVDTYLPVLEADPEMEIAMQVEFDRTPWEPTVRASWLFCGLAFLVGLLGLAAVVYGGGLIAAGGRGSGPAGFFGIGGCVAFLVGVWGVITAVRWNDRALALRDVSRETSGAHA